MTISLHPSNKPATRHVHCRIHVCRQHVELGHVKSKFKRIGDLTMDMFTKQTPAPTHEKHTATVFGTQIAPLPLFDIQSQKCNPGIRVKRAGRGRDVRKETRTFWDSRIQPQGARPVLLNKKEKPKTKIPRFVTYHP